MNISNAGKTTKYNISKYNIFAEKFLKQPAKPLWDQHKTYTKEERDAALSWLAKALRVKLGTRTMLQFVVKFKRVQEKRLRGYLLRCIRQKLPPELTLFISKVPAWMKDVEAKLQMMPKLIEECRIAGLLKEDSTQEAWASIVHHLLAESHQQQRVATLEDVQTAAAYFGQSNYQLLYRLWTRQKDSTLFKFRALHEAGDVVRDVALALTQLEWKVLDVILLYVKDFPLIQLETNKIQPLVALYQIVVAYKTDEENSVEPKDKWAKVVQEYSKKYVTSPSGIVLQRRWWELKQQVHENIRERLRTEGYKVHPLLVEIAAKYPYIVRESQEEWCDMVKNGKVYDVSDIQLDVDSSDDDDDSDEDDSTADDGSCKSRNIIDLDSDFDSEDDNPLIIAGSNKNTSKSMPDLNIEDKKNPELKPTKPQDADNVPGIPTKDQTQDLIATNTNISTSNAEHKRNSEINMLDNELNSQLNRLNDNEINSEETILRTNVSPKDNLITNNDSNPTDSIISNNDSDASHSKGNLIDSNQSENVTESNDNYFKFSLTKNYSSKSRNNTITTDYNINTAKVSIPDCNKIKTYSKATPARHLLADSVRVKESDLQKLELEFQIEMRNMMIVGRAEANADKRKQSTKIIGDVAVHDNHTFNAETDKVHKTYSTSTKKKGVKTSMNKETKVNSASAKIKTTESTKKDSDGDKLSTTNEKNMNIDEGNMAAKTLIENSDTYAKNITETPNYESKGIIATVYACKGPDGKALGHVILPAPISKDSVTVSLKTDNGTVSIDSAVVNDIQSSIHPSYENKRSVTETKPSNQTIHSTNESIGPVNKSKETDLDLLQKIDPAQAKTMIIFSDSEDESENAPINDTNQENVTNISDTHQVSITRINKEITGQKEDSINLNDVKKYLNNHSLDDILSKMGDMVVKKEVKKARKDSFNRMCESLIYVSDSDDEDTRNNEELDNNDEVALEDDNKKVTDIQNDRESVLEMVSCRSNAFTMINNSVDIDDNIINDSKAQMEVKEPIFNTNDVLNTPNANVFILSPSFLPSSHTLVSTTDITSSTPDVIISPKIESSPRNIMSPILRSNPSNVLSTSVVSRPTSNVSIPPLAPLTKILIPTKAESSPRSIPSPVVPSEPSNLLPTSMASRPTPNAPIPPLAPLSKSLILTKAESSPLNISSPMVRNFTRPTSTAPNLSQSLQISTQMVSTPSDVVIPTSAILSPIPTGSNPILNPQVPPPMVLSRQPNILRPTSDAVNPMLIPPPPVESSTSNVKIPTPNSNVVTMIINDKIGKDPSEENHEIGFKNVFDDVMSVDSDLTINKNMNLKSYKNKSSDKKQRRTKIYSETAGYSGLFKLKDRSTQETVGMLCQIKEEKSLINEVTEKIDNYLEKFKDDENNSEKPTELYNIINKKLEIESKKSSNDGFLKMMLENCQAKTLWTSGDKEKPDEEKNDGGKSDEESSVENIDPKLIMDARVYLPKLDEVDSYNKNRRVDFSINTKRINKAGYKVLNHKMKSDDPALVIDNTEPKSTVPIAAHIETEIAVALKNKIPEEIKKKLSEEIANEMTRKRPSSVNKPKSKQKNKALLVDLRTEKLDNLTKQIKKEREIQQFIDPNRTRPKQKDQSVPERINSLATKIVNERQKQQLVDVNTTNIVQRIKFECDDDFKPYIDSSMDPKVQDTTKRINRKIDDFSRDVLYDSDDMELDTVNDNTLILDSSNALLNLQDKETNINVRNGTKISENRENISNNEVIGNATGNIHAQSINENITSTDIDVSAHDKVTVSVKVEPMDTESHNVSNDQSSDDEIIPIKRPRNVKNRLISSDEEDERSPISAGGASLLKKLKKKQTIYGEDNEEYSKSDEELGMMIESELFKDQSAKELLQTEDGLLKEIRCSDDVPVKKSNIEEMLKLCKPVKLCLERVQVPKETDSQIRKVELPDRTNLKRHRAPTAHVAPINVRARQADDANEGVPEVTAEGDATEAEIGNLLQQLSKETAFEWQRCLEESAKAKRQRVSEADHTYSRREKEQTTDRQTNKLKADRNRKKKDEKKQQPQKDSDDEIDATLEWQRQKNINYKFFNFNPIINSMEPDSSNTRRDKKNSRPNKKMDFLVRKVVVDDNRMQQSEIINLDDDNDENKDQTCQKETHAAVESIINDIHNIVEYNKDNDVETMQVSANGSKLLKVVPKEIKLTPIFTKIEPKNDERYDCLKQASVLSTQLIPIATKIERKDPEKEEPPKPILKKYYSMKFKNFVQKFPKKQNSNTSSNIQPSTSKDINIPSKDPIPSTSKAASHPDFICISDDSDDVFQLTETLSVKNNDSNVTNKETSAQSVSLQDLMREHTNKQKILSTTISAPKPMFTVSPATKREASKDNLNSNNEHLTVPNASLIIPPIKVYNTIHLRNKDVNSAEKIMEIGPISSVTNSLGLVVNDIGQDEDNNDTENCPQITNVTSISNTIEVNDNDFDFGIMIDEIACKLPNTEKNKRNQPEFTPRIENVMSVQSFDPNAIDDSNVTSNNSVEEKSVRGLGLIIQNVRSIPTNIDLDQNQIESNVPLNSNDENYDSDSDFLQIDESFTTDFDEDKLDEPSSSNDLSYSNISLNTDEYVSIQKAEEHIIPILQRENGKASIQNIETPKQHPIMTTDENINSREPGSGSSNDEIGEIPNIESVKTEPSILINNVKSSNSSEKHSKPDKDVEKGSSIDKEKLLKNEDETNTINNKLEVSNTDLSNLDNAHIENNPITDDDDKADKHKLDEKDSLHLNAEEKLAESRIPDNQQDNPSTDIIDNSKENEITDIRSEKDKSNTTTIENDSKENIQASSKENSNDIENETKVEKPKTFLKVVPIQKLIGTPMVAKDDVAIDDVAKESVAIENKLRGQAMPFQCLSDEESTKNALSDESGGCVSGSMPVISNVVSLSTKKKTATDKSRSLLRPIKINKTDIMDQPKIWNPSRTEVATVSVIKRLDCNQVSTNPPIDVADFVKDRDCTNISLLCIDEWRPLWMIHNEYYMLTNLKLPLISPTYWTVGPSSQCTRILMDNKALGSTIVGALSVPDEVFLENNWYKKLRTDPMIYAKIWFVVPDLKTCKEMLNCNIQMQVYSRVTGAILPLSVLTQNSASKPAHYRINIKNIDSLQLPELATLINTSLMTKQPQQIVVNGQLVPKDVVSKPVTSDEVISLDSDDE